MILELITPEKVVLTQNNVESVVIPSYYGELGILPQHIPITVQLLPGEIRVTINKETKYYAVSGGFVEVEHSNTIPEETFVKIFAETAELAEEINVERATLSLERAKAALSAKDIKKTDILELDKVKLSIQRQFARIKVATHIRKKLPK